MLPLYRPGATMRKQALAAAFLLILCSLPKLPLRADQPLPDIPALLKQVERNQAKLEQDREKYSFTDVEEQDDVTRSGRVKKKSVDQYDVFFLRGYLIRRLVKKDGKPLSASEQRKEDARVRKLVEKYERKAQKKKSGADDDDIGVAVFLRTSVFTHPHWTQLGGREVLAFDFAPNPRYRPQTAAEKVAHTLGGEVWVDAQAGEVARVEAGFNSAYRIGGGVLASIEKGTTVTLKQTYVDGDAWLPSYTAIHARGRLLLFKGVRFNLEDAFSGYRVFHVGSLSKIGAPGKQAY